MPRLQEVINDAQILTALQEVADKRDYAIISLLCFWLQMDFTNICCFSFIPFSFVDLASVSRGREGGERW